MHRDDEHGEVRGLGVEVFEDLQPAHPVEREVEHDEVRGGLADRPERFLSGGRLPGDRHVRLLADESDVAAPGERVIFDDVHTVLHEGTAAREEVESVQETTVPPCGGVSSESGGTLVVEWGVPDLQMGDVTGSVFYGANSAGQTGPTYLSAEACGLTEPTDLATIGDGFPDVHWVLDVTGTTESGGGGPLVSVDPESGSIAQGASDEITVTADATDAEPGTYDYDVVITTNDPTTPTVTVGVTVEVLPTVANEGGATPAVFALRQNYPNPFAGRTTVAYDLADAVYVRVEVYDVAGRRVATLVDESQSAGRYEVAWDAQSLPSGVYVYRTAAGSFHETRKTVLVR